VLLLLCAADLVVMLDGMVVTVALPAIQQDLGTRRGDHAAGARSSPARRCCRVGR
jgi:hypothetical protein